MVDAFSITIPLEDFSKVAREVLEIIGLKNVELAYQSNKPVVVVLHVAEPMLESVVSALVEKQIATDDFLRTQVANAAGVLRARLERLNRVLEMIK